jgi:hypothetical protein
MTEQVARTIELHLMTKFGEKVEALHTKDVWSIAVCPIPETFKLSTQELEQEIKRVCDKEVFVFRNDSLEGSLVIVSDRAHYLP